MFTKNIFIFNGKKTIYTHQLYESGFKFDGISVSVFQCFPTSHYLRQDELIKQGKTHYFSYIASILKIEPISVKRPTISFTRRKRATSLAEKNNLCIDNFIILCPEANTCSDLDFKFWYDLSLSLKNNGFDIFINTSSDQESVFSKLGKSFFLRHDELFALAENSKCIIGLRSGLIEILAMTGVDIYTFYSDLPQRGILTHMNRQDVLNGFSINKINGIVSNVHEYLINDQFNYGIVVQDVCRRFK